jgi:hypothetical protein
VTYHSISSIAIGAPLKHRIALGATLAALLVSLAACNDSPTGPSTQPPDPVSGEPNGPNPSPVPPEPNPAPPQPSPAWPPSGPAAIYDRVTPSFIFGSSSRFVLREDATFSLQYSTPQYGFFEYLGTYSRADSLVTFHWQGWSSAGPWGADGILRGDSLIVKYNFIMQMTDFEDGVYVRTSSGSP